MPDGAAPSAEQLIERVRALPAAAPLIARLGDAPNVYVVGGAVRDLLLGREPSELDLVVEGDAVELASRLAPSSRRHDRFGTATVTLDGHTYDLSTARRESYARPGALPDVEPAGLTEDLARRDFTVNAMAIALGTPAAGELHAVPNALEDLATRRLRVLHARSFEDDPTRLLRLVRYASRLGFEAEQQTLALLERAIRSGALRTVSGPRLGAELRLLLREPEPLAALELLGVLGLDHAIAARFGLRNRQLAVRASELLPPDGREDLLMLALAALGMSRRAARALLDELAFEHRDREIVLASATDAERLAADLAGRSSAAEIADSVAGASPEQVALAGALGAERQAREWLERLRHVKLEIDGADLIAAGIPEGPAIGRALRAALSAKLAGRLEGRREELAEALRHARDSG